MFTPVGYGGATIKICPPLCVTQEQIDDGIAVMDDTFRDILDR
jgi:4-aminobutyrate aminotransferase-like enzyme